MINEFISYMVTKATNPEGMVFILGAKDSFHGWRWGWELNELEDVLNVEYEAYLSDSYYDDEYGNHVDEWGEIL